MYKFIIDTQLPPVLAKHIRTKNYNAIHTTYYEKGHLLSDNKITEIAIAENLVIITKDNDFLDNYLLNGSPPKVILLQVGNISNKELIKLVDDSFEKIIKYLNAEIELLILNKNQLIIF